VVEAAHPDARDAALLRVDHFDVEAVDFEVLAHCRHAPKPRQQIAAHGFEAVAVDGDLHQVGHLVHVHAAAQQEPAVAFFDDPFDLDVVFVADLADDLLEQVLDGDQARRAAVFIHHHRDLHAAALEFLQEIGNALGLGHEMRRPHQRCDRARRRQAALDQVLDEDEPLHVVECLFEDRDA
jgi:hypothetical protein